MLMTSLYWSSAFADELEIDMEMGVSGFSVYNDTGIDVIRLSRVWSFSSVGSVLWWIDDEVYTSITLGGLYNIASWYSEGELENTRLFQVTQPYFEVGYRQNFSTSQITYGVGAVAPIFRYERRPHPTIGLGSFSTVATAGRGFWNSWYLSTAHRVGLVAHTELAHQINHRFRGFIEIAGATWLPIRSVPGSIYVDRIFVAQSAIGAAYRLHNSLRLRGRAALVNRNYRLSAEYPDGLHREWTHDHWKSAQIAAEYSTDRHVFSLMLTGISQPSIDEPRSLMTNYSRWGLQVGVSGHY